MRLRVLALSALAVVLSALLCLAAGRSASPALAQAGPAVPIPRPCIQIYPPPPGCGGVTITTDQSQYVIGSPIQICYTVPGPGPVTIIDQQPGGLTHTLLSVYDDGTGWCFGGTITPPTGAECLLMYYGGAYYGGSPAQACFQVIGYGGGGGCYAPVQTIYTTPGNGGSITLASGQCFQLVFGSGYNWTVSVDNPSVLACGAGSFSGGQSTTCTAVGPGTTTLRATGNPTCYPQCLIPSILFQLSVTVVVAP
jgi:hypothetical protein